MLAVKPELGLVLTAAADSSSACIDPAGLDPAASSSGSAGPDGVAASGLTAADVIDSGRTTCSSS